MNESFERDKFANTNSYDDQKLLKEMSERLIRIEKRQKTERAARLIVTLLIMAAILAAVLILGPKITNTVREIRDLTSKVEEFANAFEGVDMEKLKQTIQSLSEKLDQIDISELENALNGIESIDISGISSAIEKVNEFISSLGNFSFGGLFG